MAIHKHLTCNWNICSPVANTTLNYESTVKYVCIYEIHTLGDYLQCGQALLHFAHFIFSGRTTSENKDS